MNFTNNNGITLGIVKFYSNYSCFPKSFQLKVKLSLREVKEYKEV